MLNVTARDCWLLSGCASAFDWHGAIGVGKLLDPALLRQAVLLLMHMVVVMLLMQYCV
eukprot:XP_001698172.1 predicted protein [Chlamydomonas reinhardtii]